jgi:excisionase family DNA binding protein
MSNQNTKDMTETILVAFSKHEFKELLKGTIQELLLEQATPQGRQHAAHEYLSMTEAAQYLQIPQSTLYQFCAMRRLPYVKRGKRNYFLRSDLDAFMGADRRKSVKEIEAEAVIKMRKGGEK